MQEEKSIQSAYIFWGAGLLGLCGLHRCYLGDAGMGALYCCTLGICCVGQLADLVTMDNLVRASNAGQMLATGPQVITMVVQQQQGGGGGETNTTTTTTGSPGGAQMSV
jgi:TM2 domain-containing membrane protein YozV